MHICIYMYAYIYIYVLCMYIYIQYIYHMCIKYIYNIYNTFGVTLCYLNIDLDPTGK